MVNSNYQSGRRNSFVITKRLIKPGDTGFLITGIYMIVGEKDFVQQKRNNNCCRSHKQQLCVYTQCAERAYPICRRLPVSQLLMVSGIGPSDTLKQYNISLIASLPGVGQNMWDSPMSGPSYRVNVVTDSLISQNPEYAAQIAAQYINNQSGPLTYAAGYAAYEKLPYRSTLRASTNASLALFPSDWPELGYLPVDTYTGYPSQPSTSMLNDSFNYGTIFAALVAPLSRGSVTIKSTDISDLPIIDSNWLSRPADAEVAIAGFKRAR